MMAPQGSCGYGVLNKNDYPYWSVVGISVNNPAFQSGPVKACGYAPCTAGFVSMSKAS